MVRNGYPDAPIHLNVFPFETNTQRYQIINNKSIKHSIQDIIKAHYYKIFIVRIIKDIVKDIVRLIKMSNEILHKMSNGISIISQNVTKDII